MTSLNVFMLTDYILGTHKCFLSCQFQHSGNYSAIVENNPHKMAIFVKTFERNSAKKLWFFEGILKIQTLLQT